MSLPPYDFIRVGVIEQGVSRCKRFYALAPAEAMVPAPHTFNKEVPEDRRARRH